MESNALVRKYDYSEEDYKTLAKQKETFDKLIAKRNAEINT